MLIEYHRTLLADRVRNDALHAALKHYIRPNETTVADVGAGTGVLSFLASKLGAKRVDVYEAASIGQVARQLAKTNKIKNLHFIPAHSTSVRDAEPVDLIISETLGNYAFEENIAATVEDAKRFLKPGGHIIPNAISQFVCPVTDAKFHDELTVWDRTDLDLDFAAAKEMTFNNIYVRTFAPDMLLNNGAAVKQWDHADLTKKMSSKRSGTVSWTLDHSATITGLAVWWSCDLAPNITLSTSPLAPRTHWEQLYFPVQTPLAANKGDTLDINLSSQSTYDEGTTLQWRVALKKTDGTTMRQSGDLEAGFLP